MFGIIIALLIVAWKTFISDLPVEAAFLGATAFLYTWYWIWSIILGLLMAAISLGLIAGGGAAGSGGGRGMLGGIAGAAAGAGVSVLIWVFFGARCACLLIGTFLLKTAGTADMAFADFDMTKMVIGGILLLVGLIIGRNSGSSSSSD